MKFFRTLLRVVEPVSNNNIITICIPGRDSREIIPLNISIFPENLRPLLKENYRFFAKVNFGIEDSSLLEFKDFEWYGTVESQNESVKKQNEMWL